MSSRKNKRPPPEEGGIFKENKKQLFKYNKYRKDKIMKKNIMKKTIVGFILTATLVIGGSLCAFAAPVEKADAAAPAVATMSAGASSGFFLEEDSEGYCYKVGDQVEVKVDITRGYCTIKCEITDRKSDWWNGNMYYVKPVEKLSGLQNLVFSEGWVHESDIQTIDPQPVFKAIIEVVVFFKSLFG